MKLLLLLSCITVVVNSQKCDICGEGKRVSAPDAIFEFPGQPAVPCGQLQLAGELGEIPLDQCAFIPPLIEMCECVQTIARSNQASGESVFILTSTPVPITPAPIAPAPSLSPVFVLNIPITQAATTGETVATKIDTSSPVFVLHIPTTPAPVNSPAPVFVLPTDVPTTPAPILQAFPAARADTAVPVFVLPTDMPVIQASQEDDVGTSSPTYTPTATPTFLKASAAPITLKTSMVRDDTPAPVFVLPSNMPVTPAPEENDVGTSSPTVVSTVKLTVKPTVMPTASQISAAPITPETSVVGGDTPAPVLVLATDIPVTAAPQDVNVKTSSPIVAPTIIPTVVSTASPTSAENEEEKEQVIPEPIFPPTPISEEERANAKTAYEDEGVIQYVRDIDQDWLKFVIIASLIVAALFVLFLLLRFMILAYNNK